MPTSERLRDVFEAAKAANDAGDQAEALRLLDRVLELDRSHQDAAALLSQIMLNNEKPGVAWLLASSAPNPSPRLRLFKAKALADLGDNSGAISLCEAILKKDPDYFPALAILGACCVNVGDVERAEQAARKALERDPNNAQAHNALGHALLSQGDPDGWWHYGHGTGRHEWRRRRIYAGEGQWDGKPLMKSQHVVAYGEQGIGDQIAMASAVGHARAASRLVLDVNPKLQPLFQRSFLVPTYGTFREDAPEWRADYNIAASVSLSELKGLFPAKPPMPYLVPHPEKALQWKHLIQSKGQGNLRVGISWTGGKEGTGRAVRSAPLEEMRPLFDVKGVTWVSLDYEDRAEEIEASGLPIHHWPWAVQTDDYDDTAALIANLDLIISVPQSVVHLAGAMNVPTLCWLRPDYHPHCILRAGLYPSVRMTYTLGDILSELRGRVDERAVA